MKSISENLSLECLNTVQAALVVVDSHRRVLLANPAARQLMGLSAQFSPAGLMCHQLICGQEAPCDSCLLESGESGPKSHVIHSTSGEALYIKVERLCFHDVNVLILFDVTREITALRNLDLTRRELKAKTILLERRRSLAAEERGRIQRVFDHLPDACVQVADNYAIVNKNQVVSKIMPLDSGETCYALLGKAAPCPQCPAREGFHAAGGRKITHRLGERCLTEHVIHSSADGGGILLFSDTTRQIELIEKIREQQDTITRKNDILSKLVGLQARMQRATVSTDMVNYFLDVFLAVCGAGGALIVIDDVRPGGVWLTARRGVTSSQASSAVRSYLSREVQNMDRRKIPEACLPWKGACQVELIGGNGRRVGMVLFPRPASGGDSALTQLFSEPFGAFVHNRMLLRQLEEKANTDPLTGLFNRRYVDTALAAEKKKYHKFGIPYSIIVVDVNRLKQANDQYGHDAGDKLLLLVSARLKAEIRATDSVARTGGDEFLILLADTPEAGAQCMMERLGTVFRDVSLEVGDGETFSVTVSMGAAGSDQVSHTDLFKTADERMYQSKAGYYRTQTRYR